ncbi:hypothetical protein BLX88_20500, partial [Bacillus obstructivus]
ARKRAAAAKDRAAAASSALRSAIWVDFVDQDRDADNVIKHVIANQFEATNRSAGANLRPKIDDLIDVDVKDIHRASP